MTRASRSTCIILSFCLATVLAVVGVFGPRQYMDFDAYLGVARQLAAEGISSRPHTLYQQLIVAVRALIPFSWLQALPVQIRPQITSSVTFVAAAFVVYWFSFFATSVLIFRLLLAEIAASVSGTRRLVISSLVTSALMVVGPVNLFTLYEHRLYLGYVGITVYHNPTVILLKPLALGLFLATEGYVRRESTGAREFLLVGALSVLSTMAKPSFAVCFLPAMALWLGYRTAMGRTRPTSLAKYLTAALLPAAIVLVIQYMVQYGAEGSDKVMLAPFLVIRHWVPAYWRVAVFFLLSVLFPLLFALLYRVPSERDASLPLAWLTFLIGSALMYAFAESGKTLYHGNFLWSAQVALFVLFVVTAAKMLEKGFAGGAVNRVRVIVCFSLLAFHVVCGLVWLCANLSVPGTWK
jgi:hypothetical protein